MLVTWNNDQTPSSDIVEGCRKLAKQAISRLKVATSSAMADPLPGRQNHPLTLEQNNALLMLSCWH